MSQSAANMQKAVEAMEKAQTTETQQIVVLPSYSVRFIIFMSVAAMLVVTLFPVLVIRLAVVSSELNPFHSNQEHSPANLAVNVTDAPAWTHQVTNGTALNQKLEEIHPTPSHTGINSSEVSTPASVSVSAGINTVQNSVASVTTRSDSDSTSGASSKSTKKPRGRHGSIVRRSLPQNLTPEPATEAL